MITKNRLNTIGMIVALLAVTRVSNQTQSLFKHVTFFDLSTSGTICVKCNTYPAYINTILDVRISNFFGMNLPINS